MAERTASTHGVSRQFKAIARPWGPAGSRGGTPALNPARCRATPGFSALIRRGTQGDAQARARRNPPASALPNPSAAASFRCCWASVNGRNAGTLKGFLPQERSRAGPWGRVDPNGGLAAHTAFRPRGILGPGAFFGHVHRMTHSDTLRQTFAGCTAARVTLRQMVDSGRRRGASGSGFSSGKSGGGSKRRGGRRQWRQESSAGPKIPLRCEFL